MKKRSTSELENVVFENTSFYVEKTKGEGMTMGSIVYIYTLYKKFYSSDGKGRLLKKTERYKSLSYDPHYDTLPTSVTELLSHMVPNEKKELARRKRKKTELLNKLKEVEEWINDSVEEISELKWLKNHPGYMWSDGYYPV